MLHVRFPQNVTISICWSVSLPVLCVMQCEHSQLHDTFGTSVHRTAPQPFISVTLLNHHNFSNLPSSSLTHPHYVGGVVSCHIITLGCPVMSCHVIMLEMSCHITSLHWGVMWCHVIMLGMSRCVMSLHWGVLSCYGITLGMTCRAISLRFAPRSDILSLILIP